MGADVAPTRGRFFRDVSNRLIYELPRVPADRYRSVCKLVVEQFALRSAGGLVDGWDVLFQDFQSKEGLISLEWDNWTEFTVVAKQPAAEPLVREIAAFLETTPAVKPLLR